MNIVYKLPGDIGRAKYFFRAIHNTYKSGERSGIVVHCNKVLDVAEFQTKVDWFVLGGERGDGRFSMGGVNGWW